MTFVSKEEDNIWSLSEIRAPEIHARLAGIRLHIDWLHQNVKYFAFEIGDML